MSDLSAHATALADGIERALPRWVERTVDAVYRQRTGTPPPAAVMDDAAAAGAAAVAALMPDIRALLAADIDAQRTTPLAILRTAVRYPTAVLQRAGAGVGERDAADAAMFPDDVYGITPASFADIDPELGDVGLTWGAAKAWVHLQRHRPPPRRILVYAPDLMDRSKITAAAPRAVVVAAPAELAAQAGPDALVVLDLGRPAAVDAVAAVAATGATVIGFASHVDRDVMDVARAAGCQQVLARSAFFNRVADLLS